jgi:3D (Asp-Asp-Asp) domain-containing protein
MDLLTAVAIASVTVTSYRAVPEQTDSTPNRTSINQHVSRAGAAVSPDMLISGEACYGDAVVIPKLGIRIVNDVTHPRLKRTVDIFVNNWAQEKRVGIRRVQILIIHSNTRKCTRDSAAKLEE